jgi:hypothetical protein
MLPSKGSEQFIDNVLASPQGALTGEKFERFDTTFVGAATPWRPRSPRCWPPAANCRPPWAKRCPSWTRAWTPASGPAWACGARPLLLGAAAGRRGSRGGRRCGRRWTTQRRRSRQEHQGPAPCPLSPATWPPSNAPSASSPAASTRRCAPSAPSAARRASSPRPGAPSCGTPRAGATSTTSAPGAR